MAEQSDPNVRSEYVQDEIAAWLRRPGSQKKEVQVAFYGGSFTGLPEQMQIDLLLAVRPFIDAGKVASIRLSTRPDYIHEKTAKFLFAHGVRTVELGVQSLDPVVLEKSRRGHTVYHVARAIERLREVPLLVGGQLMVGLPGETVSGAMRGAAQLVLLRPDFVRIYPTLVVQGSGLEVLYTQRAYMPLSLNKAIVLTARLKTIFDEAGIPVIRMGLQPTENLQDNLTAGPHHPAFGELVQSRIMYKKTRKILREHRGDKRALSVSAFDESIFRGQKNHNLRSLSHSGLLEGVELVFDADQPRGTICFC
jgi:histone acetyltransferase (RNA polymerase elongator complex component)